MEFQPTLKTQENKTMKNITIFIYLLTFPLFTFSQSYMLDSSFGDAGILLSDLQQSNDVATDAALAADGTLIISGCKGNPQYDFMVLRKSIDGDLDADFGNEGHSVFDLGSAMDDGTVNYIHTNGNILVAGITGTNSGVVRFLPDGAPDLSFGNNGKVIFDFTGSSLIHDMIVDEEGRIILVGSITISSSQGSLGALVIRLLPNGQLDPSFGINGVRQFTKDFSFTQGKSLAISKSGKILVGINADGFSHVVQLTESGDYDSSFGVSGYFSVPKHKSTIEDLEVLPNGKLLLTLFFSNLSTSGLCEVFPEGQLNEAFGLDGLAMANIPGIKLVSTNTFQNTQGIYVMGATFMTPDHSKVGMAILQFSQNGDWIKGVDGEELLLTSRAGEELYCAKILQNEDGVITAIGYAEDKATGNKDIAHLQYQAIDKTVGLATLPKTEKAKVFPNPVMDFGQFQYTLHKSSNISLQLYSVQGKLITTLINTQFRNQGEQIENFELPASLPAGSYFLHLSIHGDRPLSTRIIKQ